MLFFSWGDVSESDQGLGLAALAGNARAGIGGDK